jgi:tRNA-splicing ligase RtcB
MNRKDRPGPAPYKIFGRDLIEGKAVEQFLECLDHPFVVQGAAMPDMHLGYTMPIGGVIATDGVVVPSWVGYDIGCGVCAVRTTFPIHMVRDLSSEIYSRILELVPTGFNHHKTAHAFWNPSPGINPTPWLRKLMKNDSGRQLGTLGGGNHFIEIDHDQHDNVWIVIHSGSRNIGHKTATKYIKQAHPEDKAKEGTFGFSTSDVKGANYIRDMNTCLDFALDNRTEIAHSVIYAMQSLGIPGMEASPLGKDSFDFINRNHNHVEKRSVDGMWVHRKGATHAEKNMLGVIPGDMLSGSFITVGSGNGDSLCSSSHGAGRTLGRKKAKRSLNLDEFRAMMFGITCHVTMANLDESPMAYKDINWVMEAQQDNCTVAHHLKPIINVKG